MRAIAMRFGLVAATCLAAAAAQGQYDVSWHTVDGGGAMWSAGGAYQVGGTIGQADAGSNSNGMSGGAYTVVGGFWVASQATEQCGGTLLGDSNCDGVIDNGDIDCFVAALLDLSGDLWHGCALAVNPNCTYAYICANDLNHDTVIDNADIDSFVGCLLAQPPPGQPCP